MMRAAFAFAVLVSMPAHADSFSADFSGLAKQIDVQAISDAMTASGTKLSAVPTTGPGANKCRISVVPSELITSGGVTGTAGTCSRIVQCGTSSTYTVVQFNLGGGC